jgi:predicted nucleic acid-binding protein
MADRAVVNASPLVILSRAGRLELLRLVGDRIVIPQAVVEEVKGHSDEAARALEDGAWFEQAPVAVIPESIAAWDLGPGESAVLSWAVAHPGTVAIIDDHAARKCAEVVGVTVKGTLGLALLAKRRGLVPAARPVVEELRRNGLYLSDDLVARALALVDE